MSGRCSPDKIPMESMNRLNKSGAVPGSAYYAHCDVAVAGDDGEGASDAAAVTRWQIRIPYEDTRFLPYCHLVYTRNANASVDGRKALRVGILRRWGTSLFLAGRRFSSQLRCSLRQTHKEHLHSSE
jgi:hypothetical protein